MTRIVAISDTHNKLDEVKLPDGDILVHAGDWTMGGTLPEIAKFNHHLSKLKLKYKHIIVVPGNHDLMVEANPDMVRVIVNNAIMLIDEEITINGIKFYGSPWQNWFYNWAYNFPETDLYDGEKFATEKYKSIPDDVNVLITHGPAFNMLDRVYDNSPKNKGNLVHVGSKALAKRINELKQLKLHVTGHIHAAAGRVDTEKTIFVNASILNDNYIIANKPFVINI